MAALTAGLVVTALIAWWVRGLHRDWGAAAFRDDASRAIARARADLRSAAAATDALAEHLRVGVDPLEFESFARDLVVSRRGLTGLAWLPIAHEPDLPAILALIRSLAGGDPTIWEPGSDGAPRPVASRQAHAPVALVYPLAGNRALLGLDLLAVAPSGVPLDELARAGQRGAWGPVTLGWLPGAPSGIVLFTPVEPAPHSPNSAPQGIAAGIITLDDILRPADEPRRHAVELSIESPPVSAFPGFAVAAPHRPAPDDPATKAPAPPPGLVLSDVQDFNGVPLRLRAAGDPSRYFAGESNLAWIVLGIGTLSSILLAGIVSARAARARTASQILRQSRELERVNASLRDSEERYRLAFQAVDGIVYEFDLATNRSARSSGLKALLGYAPHEVEGTLEAWLALIHPEDAPRVRRELDDAVRGEDRFSIECRVRHRNGHYVEVCDRGVVVRDAEGRVRRIVGCAMSLTEKRRTEQAAREANERFALFAEATADVLWTIDLDPPRVVHLNPAFERVWGIPRAAVYSDPEAWLAAVHPDDRERVTAASRIWSSPSAPRERRIDYRIRRADGEVRWIQDTGVRLDDAHGRPYRVVGIAEDITDRKLAQIDLEESERAYRQLFDANQAAKIVFDPADGQIVQANAAAVSFYGYKREQLETMNVFDLCACEPEEVRQKLVGGLASVPHMESRHRLADGTIRQVEIFSSPIQLRGRTLVYSLILDITERKKVEAQLQESRRTLEQAQAVGRIGSWASDASPEGRLLWSSQVFRIFGVKPEEFDQQISTFFRYVHPDDVAAVRASVADAIRDHTVYRIDHRIVRPDGEVRWVLEQGEVEYDGNGAPLRVIGVVQDITERKNAERALRDNEEHLRTILEVLAEGCIVLTPRGVCIECNAAAEQIVGLPRNKLVGVSVADKRWQVFREDGTPRPFDEFPSAVVARTGQAVDGAIVGNRRADGEMRWLSVNARPLRAGDGTIVGVVVSFSDITDRLRAERALRDSEACLRDAQRIGEFGDWEYDLASGRISWSEQVYRLFRRDPAAGPPGFEENMSYYYPDDRARLVQAVRDAAERAVESDLDLHLLLPTGEDVWHRGIINVVRDDSGAVVRLKGVVQDITARKLAEHALRTTQLRLATILEHLPDVVVYEADRQRIFASDNILTLVGSPAAVFEKDRAAFERLVHPADFAEARARIERLRESGLPGPLVLQYRLRHRDGHYLWVEDRMIVEHDPSGADRVLGVLIDISDRKRAEQQQRLMMAELDHRVKNNLATIISLLEQTGRTSKNLQDFQQTFHGRLQALARMHKSLSRTHWEGVGLRTLVTQTLEAYQSSPPGRVEIVGDDVSLPARAASPIAMAIHELATNAVKYGSLSVPHGRVRVEWSLHEDGEIGQPHVLLRWSESGGPPVTEPPSPGFGTELIQGGIAYELHGEARIEFKPEGVCCTMTIPLAVVPPAPLPTLDAH
jgi:PAS domain S-box-containing protein